MESFSTGIIPHAIKPASKTMNICTQSNKTRKSIYRLNLIYSSRFLQFVFFLNLFLDSNFLSLFRLHSLCHLRYAVRAIKWIYWIRVCDILVYTFSFAYLHCLSSSKNHWAHVRGFAFIWIVWEKKITITTDFA